MLCASAKGKSRSNHLIFQSLIVMAKKKNRSFNSYTQQICVDNAVVVKDCKVGPRVEETSTTKPPNASQSRIVTYSSRHVTKLSDVLDSMNISGSHAIKFGTTGTAPPP